MEEVLTFADEYEKASGNIGTRLYLIKKYKHIVTFISSMTKLTSSSNVTVINVASNIKTFPDDLLNIKAIMDHKSDMRDDNLFFPVMDNLTLVTMQMKEVQELLNDETQSFDVVIAEWMYNEVYAG
ncbi:hypothetical protein RR48_01044 [Papilio machaon]|uniref:Uncharacterized protein n=1 Tax=Papilio machaon TaxID=76193 RepID=A0A0N1PG00_PAPMA|nr:hypothetical protein RR48_01044 [Papilio machaon]